MSITNGTALTVVYGDTSVEVPATTNLEALKTSMVEVFPELKDSTVVQEGNTIKFMPKAGTKGAGEMEQLTVVYGDTEVKVPAGTDLEALKASMVEVFPELKDASVVQEGSTVRFAPKAGTKGAEEELTVVYGDTEVKVPAGTDLEALKVSMVEVFPELKDSSVVRDGNVVRFAPKAGTKGSEDELTVVYGDTEVKVPGSTDLEALKTSMVEVFPELKDSSVVRDGNTVRFAPKAGTKGAGDELVVVYGDTEVKVPAGTDLEALKTSMVEVFPELKDSTVVQEGNTVRFAPKAGTKGN